MTRDTASSSSAQVPTRVAGEAWVGATLSEATLEGKNGRGRWQHELGALLSSQGDTSLPLSVVQAGRLAERRCYWPAKPVLKGEAAQLILSRAAR
jgi:hypothetical protein